MELRHRLERQLPHADDSADGCGERTGEQPLVVTLTNDATMASTAPAACENTYFSLPSFTGISATGGSATATTSPATDSWTS